MTQSELQEKLRQVDFLRDKTVMDVIYTDEFLSKLNALFEQQKSLRKEVQKVWKGHAPAHTVDKFMDYSAEQMRDAYLLVLNKTSELPAAQRLYIKQLGGLAYDGVVKSEAIKQFPELKAYFNGRKS